MKEVVIAGYLRTAQSRSRPNDPARDWFCQMRSDELLAKILPEVIKKSGVEPEEIDDFLVGCATGVSEQWAYGGRNPIFLANLPETIAAKFIDQQCGSAMAGIHIGFMEIAQEFADVVLIGGMEHMTRVPMGGPLIDRGAIIQEDDRWIVQKEIETVEIPDNLQGLLRDPFEAFQEIECVSQELSRPSGKQAFFCRHCLFPM